MGWSMNSRCYIVGAGEFTGRWLPEASDYVIAADAGYTRLGECGIVPDLVVGDFDSLGALPEHPKILQSPAEKDETDMMLAVRQGLACGCRAFIIDGALGGRLDQTYANFQILANISNNDARGILLGKEMCATAIRNGSAVFSKAAQGYISVFSAGDRAEGVTLEGLKYPLNNATLTYDFPLGCSNEFVGAAATVSVRVGTLIIIWAGEVLWLDF